MSNPTAEVPATPGAFAPTRWTLVLRASADSGEGRTALSELCAAYYSPVFRFLQRSGHGEDAAQEIAQEFFARVLARGGFAGPDPARGRRTTCSAVDISGIARSYAARGGGAVHESLDHAGRFARPVADPRRHSMMRGPIGAGRGADESRGGRRSTAASGPRTAALRPVAHGRRRSARRKTARSARMRRGRAVIAAGAFELLKAEVAQQKLPI
jgi:hypothetical protein